MWLDKNGGASAQREIERCAASGLRLRAHRAAVLHHHAMHYAEADAGADELVMVGVPLKSDEELVRVLF